MKTINEAMLLVDLYCNTYRHPNLPKFEISKLYNLFPGDDIIEYGWPDIYPNATKAGVYLLLNAKQEVLYVGKSTKSLGERLSKYFKFEDDRSCCIKDCWSEKICYIATIAMPENSKFENASLEEFLIRYILPPDNTNLKR